jgi:hypothetical protein
MEPQSLAGTNVRITEEEMDHLPDRKDNSIPLPDGGYYATLNAYHNLHCVVRSTWSKPYHKSC